jgi:hypothetical protein
LLYKPILLKVELFTDDDEPAPRAIQVGARLKLRMHLRLPHEVPNFTCGVGFNSVFGQRVLTLNTSYDPNLSYDRISGETVLVCDIPSLTLVAGEYFIFLFIDFGTDRKDAIPDSFMLSVQEGDYYGTGKNPFSGVFVVPHRWSLEPVVEPSPEGVLG